MSQKYLTAKDLERNLCTRCLWWYNNQCNYPLGEPDAVDCIAGVTGEPEANIALLMRMAEERKNRGAATQ